jgi:hypothetical protein
MAVLIIEITISINFYRHYIYRNHSLMDSFYIILFYPIIFILFPFLINHITLCLESRVDMVSNLDGTKSKQFS